ncbi:hypothetical protein Glove_46g90 [Diversispora epigaea]|uniref:Uncharacterized protein n=1 Tax=Diversispora epigaea TaxID=1348612 RepID=A0A397JQG4_9GLOM|nr:hypothetical protein Glove_46g90 [Diversispora epigaea]
MKTHSETIIKIWNEHDQKLEEIYNVKKLEEKNTENKAEVLELTKKKKDEAELIHPGQYYTTGKGDVPFDLKEPTLEEMYWWPLSSTSKPIHSQTDLVVCEKDREANETIALGLIFRYFRIDFVYCNKMEVKEDYPYKIKLYN